MQLEPGKLYHFKVAAVNADVYKRQSKDFARALRDNLVTDLTAQFGEFGKRYLWDRNYSETRLPEVQMCIRDRPGSSQHQPQHSAQRHARFP